MLEPRARADRGGVPVSHALVPAPVRRRGRRRHGVLRRCARGDGRDRRRRRPFRRGDPAAAGNGRGQRHDRGRHEPALRSQREVLHRPLAELPRPPRAGRCRAVSDRTASDRRGRAAVNAAGLVQGIALVTFPAASGIFTSGSDYGLSSSQYGLMFAPQVAAAIIAALLGAGLLWPGFTRRVGEKKVYLAGLLADLAAMVLLIASWGLAHAHPGGYVLLLAATACLGAGFGLTVPSLNPLAAAFRPAAADRAVLVLNALLGLGTALAPAFVAAFTGIGFWIGLPILVSCLIAGLIAVSLRLPLSPASPAAGGSQAPAPAHNSPAPRPATARIPPGFWLFGAFAFLYGVCETMHGNWSQLDLTSLGVGSSTASFALTGFWAVVTAGRVLFAAIARWVPSRAV